ncbi:sigma-70 family RNA polymerase sigma factor [Kineococcus sp. NUM-3379]
MTWRGEPGADAPPRRHSDGAVPAPRTEVVSSLRDEQDVARAYDAYGAELYRFVLRFLRDPGAAQDVVQETFLRAWRAADRYDPSRASVRVWLFAIARHTVLDHLRAAGVRPWQATLPGEAGVESAAAPAEDHSEHLVRGWVVEEALSRLSDEHRSAIVETYLKDRPYAELADQYGVPVGTVRSRVFYGLKALRAAMREMGVQQP